MADYYLEFLGGTESGRGSQSLDIDLEGDLVGAMKDGFGAVWRGNDLYFEIPSNAGLSTLLSVTTGSWAVGFASAGANAGAILFSPPFNLFSLDQYFGEGQTLSYAMGINKTAMICGRNSSREG